MDDLEIALMNLACVMGIIKYHFVKLYKSMVMKVHHLSLQGSGICSFDFEVCCMCTWKLYVSYSDLTAGT